MAEFNLKSRSSDYFFWVLTVSHSPQLPTGLRMFSPVRMPATNQKRRTNDRYEGNQKIFKKVHVGRRGKRRCTRIMEGPHPKAIPDHFHPRKCIYLFVSIKAGHDILPGERVAATHLKVPCQKKIFFNLTFKIKKKISFITGRVRHSQPPTEPTSQSVIMSVISYTFKVLYGFHSNPTWKAEEVRTGVIFSFDRWEKWGIREQWCNEAQTAGPKLPLQSWFLS